MAMSSRIARRLDRITSSLDRDWTPYCDVISLLLLPWLADKWRSRLSGARRVSETMATPFVVTDWSAAEPELNSLATCFSSKSRRRGDATS